MPFVRPEIIRPPSEHASYYLPLTSGCSNNSCTFCAFSLSNLGIRDLEDVKREIDAMSMYVNHGMWVAGQPQIVYAILQEWDGRKVFLQDGDALVYPYPKLLEALQYLNQKSSKNRLIGGLFFASIIHLCYPIFTSTFMASPTRQTARAGNWRVRRAYGKIEFWQKGDTLCPKG